MRLLWITNILFPDLCKILQISLPVYGGWMYSLAQKVATSSGIQLAIATIYKGKEIKTYDLDGVVYYLLPGSNKETYKKKLESYWRNICCEFKPDIIHIHGTEYPNGLACMHAFPLSNYVISIQGMISIYSRHYYAGISAWDIIKNITFRDIIRFDTLFQSKRSFEKRGELEKEYFNLCNHVIGRTLWDYVHVKTINPYINYHLCNEPLRNDFYTCQKWDIKHKTDYVIFLNQAIYPIKGLHCVLKVVSLLKLEYPNIKVRIAGSKIINTSSFMEKIKISGYGAYINSIMKKNKLKKIIEFTWTLE